MLGNHSLKEHENILVHIFSLFKLNLPVYTDQEPSSLVFTVFLKPDVSVPSQPVSLALSFRGHSGDIPKLSRNL